MKFMGSDKAFSSSKHQYIEQLIKEDHSSVHNISSNLHAKTVQERPILGWLKDFHISLVVYRLQL